MYNLQEFMEDLLNILYICILQFIIFQDILL